MKTKYIAHIVIEADTPLKIGSSNISFFKDSPIQRDWNGLPMILGTSIAGVLRKDFKGNVQDIFGEETGSKVIFSNALLLDENGRINEDLLLENSKFLQIFDTLPLREHTAITNKGVAKEHSKFDEEVVYKGSRFKFSIEMLEDEKAFEKILSLLQSPSFRIGGGSTKGFGKFKVIEIKTTALKNTQDLENYSSSLNTNIGTSINLSQTKSETHISYTLKLTPDDFFMFGSGFGDKDADQTPIVEKIVDYHKKDLSKNYILFPASSLKGAIAHRATYNYNLQKGYYIGNENAKDSISELFGEAKNSKENINGSKGKVLFSDAYKLDNSNTKVFDHVCIDRFTGGAKDGALFQEKTVAQKDEWSIDILVQKDVEEEYLKPFETTLKEICKGLLPLGGATTKGHGVFKGTLLKDGEVIDVNN